MKLKIEITFAETKYEFGWSTKRNSSSLQTPFHNVDRPVELDDIPNFIESLRKLSSTIDINNEHPTIYYITQLDRKE